MINEALLFLAFLSIFDPCYSAHCQQRRYDNWFQRPVCESHRDESLEKSKELPYPVSAQEGPGAVATENKTSTANLETAKPAADSELASFDEWKQQILSAENGSDQVNSAPKPAVASLNSAKKTPLNFASLDCGARIVASNQESTNVHTILTESTDEYMNNPCSAPRKYFVVELCDSVSISEIEIGNLELFSSLPKVYNVSISDRYPTKEWFHIGKLYAREERVISSFKMTDVVTSSGILKPLLYAKFVKVELLEHYGAEHYCPLTIIRVYGSGLLEDDDPDPDPDPSDDAESPRVLLSENLGDVDSSKPPTNTLFSAAKKTVMQIFKHVLPDSGSSRYAHSENSSLSPNGTASFETPLNQVSVLRSALTRCFRCTPSSRTINRCPASSLCFYYQLSAHPYSLKSRHSNVANADSSVLATSHAPIPADSSSGSSSSSGGGVGGVGVGAGVGDSISISATTTADPVTKKSEKEPATMEREEALIPCDSDKIELDTANLSTVSNSTSSVDGSRMGTTPVADAISSSPLTAEQIIVESLMAPVDGIAASENDHAHIGDVSKPASELAGAKGATLTPNNRPIGQLGRGERRPSLSSTATSKQLLVRFVGRVRELELNLSLTNLYLEQLSLNYRRRLDELKLRVDTLTNVTSAQALEIERLSNLLNSANQFYEKFLFPSDPSTLLCAAIFIVSVIFIALGLFLAVIFKFCQWCKKCHVTTQTNGVSAVNGPSHFPAEPLAVSASLRNRSPRFVLENADGSRVMMVGSQNVSSAPTSPFSSISGSSESTPRRHSSTESPNSDDTSSRTNADSGIADCLHVPATPVVVPTNMNKSFLLSPLDKNTRRKRNHNNTNGKKRQSLSPIVNSAK